MNFEVEATITARARKKRLLQAVWDNINNFNEQQLYNLLRLSSYPYSMRKSEQRDLRRSVSSVCKILKICGKGNRRMLKLSEATSLFSLLVASIYDKLFIIEPVLDVGEPEYFDYAVGERLQEKLTITHLAEVKRLFSTRNLKGYTEAFVRRINNLKGKGIKNVTFVYHIHLTRNFIGKTEVLEAIEALKSMEMLFANPYLQIVITFEETYSKFKDRLKNQLALT